MGLTTQLLDHLGNKVVPHWPVFLPQMLQDITNPATELRMPACFGVSLAAKDPAFSQFAAETAKTLAEVVSQSRGREKKKSEKPAQAAADNAVSAIVEILLNHSAALGGGDSQL